MMTVEAFQQEKARLLALYGDTPRDASGKRAQALATLYAESEWGQRQLMEIEQLSLGRINQLLNFGKWIRWMFTQGEHKIPIHEKQFRPLWKAADNATSFDARCQAVRTQVTESQGLPVSKNNRQAVRRLSKQLIEQFADGKWHALRDMTEAVEADSIMIRGIMDRMVKEGTFQTYAERKSSGKGWYSYRMVKGGKKKIDLQVFQTEIAPTMEEMESLVNGHAIHFSQGAMKMALAQLRKVIENLTR